MKTASVVRRTDAMGRIVIPREIRDILSVKEGDSFAIFIGKDTFALEKYEPACLFCNSMVNVHEFQGKKVCQLCIIKMNELTLL